MRGRWIAVLAALLVAVACERGPERFEGVGVVRDVRPDLKQIVIDHEDIPGLMPGMTMNFDVPDPAILEGVAAGQRVHFHLTFDGQVYRVVDVQPEGAAGAAGEAGSAGTSGVAGSAGLSGVPPEAEQAPDFALVDQDGRPRSLASLRGKVVLLDFVWSHCPGPCPILTGTHVRVQKILPPEARDRVWFASVTLDPERDTPEVLRQYATKRGADLASWSFLTGPKAAVDEVITRYGVGTARLPNGEIQHVVVTFLIDAEGRIAKRYFGLEHHADDVARDVAEAARRAG